MFYLQKSVLNVKRHKLKSLLMMLVCTLIVLFLFLYIGGMQANQQQLADLPGATPVYARVSNLNGTMTSDGLMIQENVIDGLEKSPHVKELYYTVKLGTALGRIREEDVPNMGVGDLTFPLSLGVNSPSAYPSLPVQNIDFLDGIGPGFLEGDDAMCILRDRELKSYHLVVGDSIWLTLFYPTYPNDRYDLTYKRLGEFEVKIVGSYGEVLESEEENQPAQIIFPSKWVWKMYKQAGVMFFADSARFRVADPLELNAFKAEMKDLRLMSVISEAQHSHRGIALTVNDETFIHAASRLIDNIALMRVFTPFICFTVGLVGFVVSYLLLQSRKPEIAVMRSLGMSKKSCFALFFLENAILNLTGSIMGISSAALFTEISITLTMVVTVMFFFCYMAGTVAALKLLGRYSVVAVLSALE